MIPASEIRVGDYDPKNGRNSDGRFATGNAGQPKGPRHKTTRVIEELLAGEAEGLTQKAIELALAGDTMALSLCLERFAPPREYATVEFDLPAIQTAHDAAQAVLQAVSGGKLTPVEGASVMGLVEQYRRTLELTDIDPRLRALEVGR